jgi:hypothetical protein
MESFLHFTNYLRLGENDDHSYLELNTGYRPIDLKTFRRWRVLYQETLGASLGPLSALIVGGKDVVTVVDESVVGVQAGLLDLKPSTKEVRCTDVNRHGLKPGSCFAGEF